MGMDICFRDRDFRCSAMFWAECLTLGELFGWKPAGTVAPAACHQGGPDRVWSGNYCTNEYQEVTHDDAIAFAMALKRAIDAAMMEHPLTVEQAQAVKVFEEAENDSESTQYTSIKRISVRRVAELAALASKGGFMIA